MNAVIMSFDPSKKTECNLRCPNLGASGIFPVGVVCVIWLLSTTWPRFQSFPLLYADREG